MVSTPSHISQGAYLDLFSNLSRIISQTNNLPELLRASVEVIQSVLQVRNCSIMLLGTDEAVLRMEASSVIPEEEWPRIKVPVGEGIAGNPARARQLIREAIEGTKNPDAFGTLIDALVTASTAYLVAQLQAGADAVQIFDSWAGMLSPDGFRRWAMEPAARIAAGVRAQVPGARIIGFPKGADRAIGAYAAASGAHAVGADWTVRLAAVRRETEDAVALQGNLDPMALVAGGSALDAGIDTILTEMDDARLIFNLGHGIVPETPIAHVERLVRRVRG